MHTNKRIFNCASIWERQNISNNKISEIILAYLLNKIEMESIKSSYSLFYKLIKKTTEKQKNTQNFARLELKPKLWHKLGWQVN